MRTEKTLWAFAAAVAFLVAGIVTRDVRFLALALPLLLYRALAGAFAPPPPSLVLARELESERSIEGQDISVALKVRNEGEFLPLLEVVDLLPPRSQVTDGTNHLFLTLPQGAVKTLRYRVSFSLKGRYGLGPVVVRNWDPLGLYMEELRIDVPHTMVVSPRLEDLRRVALYPRRTTHRLGQVRSRTAGLGLDFWAIRGYQAGDEMRRINWKASARLDSLLTNEKEAERSGDILIVLDARQQASVGLLLQNTVELGIRAAVSLAAKLLQDRHRVGLVVQRDVLDWVYPAFGRKQFYRILDALLSVRPGGEWPFEQIAWVLTRFFPPKAHLIVISPLVDRAAMESVVDLRARGSDILLLSPSSLEVERLSTEGNGATELAYRVLKMFRDANVSYLRRFASVVDWNPEEPLALALKEVSLWQRYGR